MMFWFSIARFADLQGNPLVGNEGRRVGKSLQRRGRKDGRRDRPSQPIAEVISARCDLCLRNLAARLQSEREEFAGRLAQSAAQQAAAEATRKDASERLVALKAESEPDTDPDATPGQDALARRARATRTTEIGRLTREVGQLDGQVAEVIAAQESVKRERDELTERYVELAAAEVASAEQLYALYVAGRVEKGAPEHQAMLLRPLPSHLRSFIDA